MLVKLRENVEFFKAEMIKQVLGNEKINVIIKATGMIGSEYLGYGVRKDIYIEETRLKQAEKLLNELETLNIKEEQND